MSKTILNYALASFMLLSLASCQKDEDVKLSYNTSLYVEASLNGKTMLLPEGKDDYKSIAFSERSTSGTGCLEKQTLVLAKAGDSKKSLGVTLHKELETCTVDCATLGAMFETGSYSFAGAASGDDGVIEDGVVVFYIDINEKRWSTDQGSADQTGSSFEIIEHEAYEDAGSEARTKATFECKLYDGQGNVMTVTDGVINSRSLKCS